MLVFGVIFLITTILILLFKKENNRSLCSKAVKDESKTQESMKDIKHSKISMLSTYKMIFSIIKLVPIRKLIFIFLTCKVFFIYLCYLKNIHYVNITFLSYQL